MNKFEYFTDENKEKLFPSNCDNIISKELIQLLVYTGTYFLQNKF